MPEAPPRDGDAVATPWMGIVALAILAAVGLVALRLRFSDASAVDRTASRTRGGGEPIVVPRPTLLSRRSHHEKIHDERYLSLILEAELEPPHPSQAREDGGESPPARD